MTRRICRAMENPYMNVLGHPTGRLILSREGYELDWEKIFLQAKKTNTAFEINSYLERLDLDWQNVKRAVQMGIKIAIGTDAHAPSHFSCFELGISQARRGWATKKDILNCLGFEEIKKELKRGT
jgi:DNA polymerase (family 10)